MVLAIGVGASWTPWDELLAAGRAADHAAYQPTASERERREHVLARVATLIGRRGGPVLRVSLGETPDLRHPTDLLRVRSYSALKTSLRLGVMTLRNGHILLFILGLFLPLLWLFGAFMSPKPSC